MQPKYDETREAATRTQNEREEVKHKIENLYAKQGRGRQFTSQEDRDAYPALFQLPEHCYEVKVDKPMGIAFIETSGGGVEVEYLVEGSNAEKVGVIKPGDVLLATTACMGRDGTFERRVVPSRYLDFDTIMAAIGSNAPKFHKKRKNDVILQFARPDAPMDNDGDPYAGGKRGVKDYLESIKFPSDSPWLAR